MKWYDFRFALKYSGDGGGKKDRYKKKTKLFLIIEARMMKGPQEFIIFSLLLYFENLYNKDFFKQKKKKRMLSKLQLKSSIALQKRKINNTKLIIQL